jgi:ZIP family zinc transporter
LGTAALPLLKPLFFPTGRGSLIQTGLFLGLGIAAHNFPEGLVIGAGYLASQELGFSLALALCLHNIPEGMAMAAPLLAGGVGRTSAVLLTIAAGLPMGLGALAGGLFGQLTPTTLAGTLGFAAGAMLFLVFHELLPEANCLDFPLAATLGAIFGVMLGLGLLVIH